MRRRHRAEGVHFRRSSADGVIRNSRIERTGTAQPEYGEGVHPGSADSNWAFNTVTGATSGLTNIAVTP